VKQTMGSGLREGDLAMATFEAIKPALPQAKALILNGIGEPLLHPQLEEFIRRAKGLMPEDGWVGFQTNGLLLSEARALSLVQAGLDRICLSLDAIHPATFKKLRAGGEVRDLAQAFQALQQAHKACPESNLQIGVEFVAMRDNVHQLPDVLRWVAARGASFALVTNLLPYDQDHASRIAYDSNTDEALAIYRTWQGEAATEGIDLRAYVKAVWKRPQTPGERKAVDFVQAMMAEARTRDIFLHVENLLKRDGDWAEETLRLFKEAEAVARETGLELTLPSLAPRNDRKCTFVDEGSVFISWDGKVHPCYFLWHTFQCHFPGRKKHVKARSFGNLAEQGIGEIWNAPPYLAFRNEVLQQDYPFCSNCNLLPCEYLEAETFQQDCFTSTIPCGDCFWCTGLFLCMA